VAKVDPTTPVVLLDTGKLFDETLTYRDTLIDQLGLTDVRSVQPDPARIAELDPQGGLWEQDPDLCCQIRKVEPLGPALESFDMWITGRKRYQGKRRAVLPVIEASNGRIKINPVAIWSRDVISDYFRDHDLPRHPLEADGYSSVGCMPCTDRAQPGEDPRAGRWRSREKDECGIHETPAGQSLTSSEL
jgi:phosphoadenosine phosphosulfate reductase